MYVELLQIYITTALPTATPFTEMHNTLYMYILHTWIHYTHTYIIHIHTYIHYTHTGPKARLFETSIRKAGA